GLSATTADFASDAATVLHQLKKQYKNNRIGILGHSEGGQIAFMLAGSNKHKAKPDYIVTLGAPALPGDSILAEQSVIYLRSAGIDSIACEDYRKAVLKLYAVMKTKGIEAAQKTIPSICPGWDFLPQYAAMKANINAITENTTPWLLYSISYSPASDIRAAKCPMLVLYGNKDTQVPSNLNAQIVTNLNPQAQVESFNGLNHLMQHCITGNVNEYGKIQETIAPEVMDRIANFIHSINTK
ncbi:MAG: alpha/beta hydrolase, partial [Paramuribaculum sp.]|nr:alpha/beta hydrolase [Paramuribaculum sp.]